jgi:hypothetical protein
MKDPGFSSRSSRLVKVNPPLNIRCWKFDVQLFSVPSTPLHIQGKVTATVAKSGPGLGGGVAASTTDRFVIRDSFFILKNRQILWDLPVFLSVTTNSRKGYFFIFFMKTASALLAAASAFSAAFSALAAASSALWAAISAFLTTTTTKESSHSHFAGGGGGGGGGGGAATTLGGSAVASVKQVHPIPKAAIKQMMASRPAIFTTL